MSLSVYKVNTQDKTMTVNVYSVCLRKQRWYQLYSCCTPADNSQTPAPSSHR